MKFKLYLKCFVQCPVERWSQSLPVYKEAWRKLLAEEECFKVFRNRPQEKNFCSGP